jgi:hypothetical protein
LEQLARSSKMQRKSFIKLLILAAFISIAARTEEHWGWDDLRFPASAIKRLGTTDPDWVNLNGGLFVLAFDGAGARDEEIFFMAQLPHTYKQETDLKHHLHWGPIDGTSGNVSWCSECSWQNPDGGAFPASSTTCVDVAAGAVAKAHLFDDIVTYDGTGLLISVMGICRLYRNATHANDTYDNKDALLYETDFHFQRDSIGSSAELTK